MVDLSNVDLLRRIEELEAANSELRKQSLDGSAAVNPAASSSTSRGRRRGLWRTVLATILIVLGSLLAPVALVASWSKMVLTDTDQFVAAYAPLSNDPAVQGYVTDEAVAVINEQVDIPQITSDVIDGVTELGTGPRATQALELLKGPAASGVQTLIENGVTTFVESDAFSNVWASALRISHTQLLRAMGDSPNAAVQIDDSGVVGIQLGPVIDAVKTELVDQGIDLANQIPEVDRTIVIAQSDALASARLAYDATVAAGAWLPWIAIFLLAAGVLVARRRSIALIWAAVALALSMGLALVGFVVGGVAAITALSPDILPSDVTRLLYETVAGDMRATAVAVLVLAVVVAVVAWLAGPFDVPRRLRGLASEAAASVRGWGESRGITTGRAGEWIYTRRMLLRGLIAVAAAAVVLFVRPVTIGLTLWTLVLAAALLAIVEVVQRPVVTVPATAESDVPVVTVE